MPSSEDTARSRSRYCLRGRYGRRLGLTAVILLIVAVEPALAQTESAVCSAERLPGMIEGFFQLTTSIGIIGLALVWQADSLAEMFMMDPEQKMGLRKHKQSAMKSAVVLVTLGPLYTVAGSMMGLPMAECVNLAPW